MSGTNSPAPGAGHGGPGDPAQRVMPIRQGAPSLIYRTTGTVPQTKMLRVRITEDMGQALTARARQRGMSKAALVRETLARMLSERT